MSCTGGRNDETSHRWEHMRMTEDMTTLQNGIEDLDNVHMIMPQSLHEGGQRGLWGPSVLVEVSSYQCLLLRR